MDRSILNHEILLFFSVQELMKQKEDLIRERDDQLDEIAAVSV